jgi:carboxy-terminal domain RNA polymerase II polypeptide A small phosphatase
MIENMLLILDLDETLIHATKDTKELQHDFKYQDYYIFKRPYLESFLVGVNSKFDLAIWSSADDNYVSDLVSKIKPADIDFKFIWGRTRCSYRRDLDLDQYNWEKRLKKVKSLGYKLEKVLIIDDTQEKCRNNYGNAIYIKEFLGDPRDQELLKLAEYLEGLSTVENVRTVEKRHWSNS